MTCIESHDGHHWLRLSTDAEIDTESTVMGIDIRQGGWMQDMTDSEPSHDGVWSLRAADGARVITAEVRREWEDGWNGEDEYPYVDGTNLDEVRGPGGRPVNAAEVLHIASLRAWFREQGVTLRPVVWRDAGTVVQEWSDRSGSVLHRKVEQLYVDETGARIREVKADVIPPMIVYGTELATAVDGVAPGSVAIVRRSDKEADLLILRGETWKPVEVGEGVRIRVSGYTIEATPGRMVVQAPTIRPIYDARGGMHMPRTMYVAVGSGGPQIERLVTRQHTVSSKEWEPVQG